jgi:arylsulfatase A-like enzyme
MNVVVIVANGLRPSEMGPYGNEWLPTPHLDRLAAESIVFDQHFLDASPFAFHTRAHSAMVEAESPIAWPSQVKIIEYPNLLPPWDPPENLLEEQFEDWEFEEEPEPWLDPLPAGVDSGDQVALERLRRTYAASVRRFDDWLGELLDQSNHCDLLILTSWRGQNFGEHGIVGDFRPWLYEEFVHLPLIVRLPGREQAGRRVWHLTQSLDIAPTIFDSLGSPVPEGWHGRSLLPLCRGGGALRDYIVMSHVLGEAGELALQSPEVKSILPTKTPPDDPPRTPMFFVKPDDRWDVNDLRQQNLDYAEQLERTILEFVAAAQRPGPLVAPPLPQREMIHADRETGGREHDGPESEGGV